MYQASERKALGAYYTDATVAEVIARWAVAAGDRVLDPSCGDGAFLEAVSKAQPTSEVVGVEISEPQAAATKRRFASNKNVKIIREDFFDFDSASKFDAVVGNPPFIRYQSFTGASREKALFRAASAAVRLSKLTSSWAPFVICGAELIADGGRLGMVLPTELLHAGYAKPVLQYLRTSFNSVTILTFRERLFPDLSQDVLILLAAGKGASCSSLLHVDVQSIADVGDLRFENVGRFVDPDTYLTGSKRMKEGMVDSACTTLLDALVESGAAFRLGDKLHADIGYVTGANEFFHLADAECRRRRIPPRFLSPTVYRGRSLSGLTYRVEDWKKGNEQNDSGHLLRIEPGAPLTRSVEKYLEEGIALEYHKRYKCRVRDPWYAVPHVYRPEAFLTSMSGHRPSIVANDANVLASNSLHILRARGPAFDMRALVVSWLSSITSLSIEIEGHALGGGMLKLEPTEAERVIVVDLSGHVRAREFQRLDRLVRSGKYNEASQTVDDLVTRIAGVSPVLMNRVRASAQSLRERRMKVRK